MVWVAHCQVPPSPPAHPDLGRPAFLKLLAGAFRSGVHQADFIGDTERARLAINALVQQQTNGKIKDLFAPGSLNEYTRLVLTNAIYLKARWRRPFDPNDTRQAPFHTLDGAAPKVPTMHQQPVILPHAQGDGWQAVELAYKGGALAMDVLLPATVDFASFQRGLSPDRLAAMLGALRPTRLDLALPKSPSTRPTSAHQVVRATRRFKAAGGSGVGQDRRRIREKHNPARPRVRAV